MQPLTIILGIVLGSVFSIAFGLGIVLVIFGLRQDQDIRFASELPQLAMATAIFTVVAVLAAAAFAGSVRVARWRYWAMVVLLLSLVGAGWYYWPG